MARAAGKQRNDEGMEITLVDAGLVAELQPEDRRNFVDLFSAIVRNDGVLAARLMVTRARRVTSSFSSSSSSSSSSTPLASSPTTTDANATAAVTEAAPFQRCVRQEEFEQEIADIVHEVHKGGMSLRHVSIGSLLQRVLVACYRHEVKLESRFVSVIIAIGVLEGLGRRLDPDVDILRKATPFILKAAMRSS